MKSTGNHKSLPISRMREKHPGNEPGVERAPASVEETEYSDEDPGRNDLLCRQCLLPITSESSGIAVNGAHCHTFANPHGIVFEIGTFKVAPGCAAAGRPSSEFSWFPPHSWQVALCSACLTHVGWRFLSPEGGVFFGLILDRLIRSEAS